MALWLMWAVDVAALSQAGATAMKARRYAEAARIYRELADAPGAGPQWRLNLGIALHSAGRYHESVPELHKYLKAVPAPGPAHLLAGAGLVKLEQACAAVPLLEAARRWRATPEVLGPLADAYGACQRHAEAGAVLVGLGEKRQAARAYWLARDYPKARPLFAAVAAGNADDPRFAYEYGDTLLRVAGAEVALPVLEKAVALVEGRGTLGKAYLELGRHAEAIPHLEAAVAADGNLLLPLSRCYKAVGRTAEAEKALAAYQQQAGR
jgi:predicted Zn-dependent protease